jgi:hypothetical protein
MRDDLQQVISRCPRCGTPMAWSVRPDAVGYAVELAGFACACALADDEWEELREAATEAFEALADEGAYSPAQSAAYGPPSGTDPRSAV